MPTADRETYRKAVVVVLDSVGCGALPDACDYGDAGADTLGNVACAVGGLSLPNLERLGLGTVGSVLGVDPEQHVIGFAGKAAEASVGKDTTTGHWEIAGLVSEIASPTYPEGFPADLMERFRVLTGHDFLGNKPASGTAILDELGEEHVRTGALIVYTSADSVFQIAAHEDVVDVEELYRICGMVRDELLVGEHAVGRVIARPFIGEPGAWKRTHRRRDFALQPHSQTVLDAITATVTPVRGVGKIGEIFGWRGVTSSPHVENNMDAWDRLLEAVSEPEEAFVFANLVDFDMIWGHRGDAAGYASGLEAIDARVPELLESMREGDLLIITADHGCDPTDDSTDHTREYVPILAHVIGCDTRGSLGTRDTFADVGATVAEYLDVAWSGAGRSFLGTLRGGGSS